MRLKRLILLIFSVSITLCSSGQYSERFTQSRILFLLDESSSMLQTWEGAADMPKNKIANLIVVRLMDSIYAVNPHVEFSLRVFGNQYTVPEHNCTDTKSEVPFSPDNRTQMEFRLDDMHPLGVTAIAYSLSEAAEKDLVDVEHNAYSIILITDGGESCGGDICGVMQKLIRNKVFFKPYILSLEDVPELKNEYACMGDYLQVTRRTDINKAVTTIVDAFKPIIKISKEEYIKLQKIAANAPSILKVNIPQVKIEQAVVDTVAEQPKPVVKPAIYVKPDPKTKIKPLPKPVDTVAVVPAPAPKPSAIVVGEDMPRAKPVPLKMKSVKPSALVPMFTAHASKYKPKNIEIEIPEIKPVEVEPAIVIPPPVKMKALSFSASGPWKITKPVIRMIRPKDTLTEFFYIEPPQPETLAKIAPAAIKRIKIKRPALYEPSLLAVTVPEIKAEEPAPAPLALTPLQPTRVKKLKITKPAIVAPDPVSIIVPEIRIKEEEPIRPMPVKLIPGTVTGIKEWNTEPPKPLKLKKVKITTPEIKPIEPDVVKADTVVPPPPPVVVKRAHDVFTKLKPSSFRMHLLYVNSFMDAEIKLLKIGPPPPPKIPVEIVTKPKPVTPPKPVAKTGEYTVEHEDAKQTTLEVYLTNGKGKFYTTTPRMIIRDQATGKEIRKFFRNVDEKGNPDPITDLPAGKYDLEIVGREDLLAHVDLLPNKKNKVLIKVKNYSLYFYYEGAPERPVTEFSAEVIQRNVPNGKVVVQKCVETLEYETGNYHITINTFPPDIRNTELDASAAGGIAIPQPGVLKVELEVNTNSVVLYKQVGDKFLPFYTVNLSDPAKRRIQIQPGLYQAHYNNGQTKFSASDRVISFQIKSTQETAITLVK